MIGCPPVHIDRVVVSRVCHVRSFRSDDDRVTSDPVEINGLWLRPEAGTQIRISPSKRTIRTTGPARLEADAPGGPILLARQTFNLPVPRAGSRQTLGSLDAHTDLKGFPLKGKLDLELLPGGGLRVPFHAQLPDGFAGVTGEGALVAHTNKGLDAGSVRIGIDEADLGGPTIKDTFVSYTPATDEWAGGGTIELPSGGPALTAYVRFQHGAFREGRAEVTVPYPGIPLFGSAFLYKIRGGFAVDPPTVSLGGTVGVVPTGSTFVLTVDADVTISFGDPWRFTMVGKASLFDTFDVADAKLVVTGDGYAAFDGAAHLDLVAGGFGLRADAPVKLAFDLDAGLFSGEFGGVEATFVNPVDDISVNLGADTLIGSKGFGVCTTIDLELTDVDVGFVYSFDDGFTPFLDGCNFDRIRVDIKPRQSGPTTVDVPKTSVANLNVRGATAVDLIDPSGRRVTPADFMKDPKAPVAALAGLVVLHDPAPGRWTVVAREGTVTGVDLSTAEPAPKLRLKVTGHTVRSTLSKGVTATLVEHAPGGLHPIGVLKPGTHRLSFTPAAGAGGRRKLDAVFAREGIPFDRRGAGSYVAPSPPRLTRAKHLRIVRTKTGIQVRWTPGRGADRQLLLVASGDGLRRLLVLGAHASSARVAGIDRDDHASVALRGATTAGRRGPAAKARS